MGGSGSGSSRGERAGSAAGMGPGGLGRRALLLLGAQLLFLSKLWAGFHLHFPLGPAPKCPRSALCVALSAFFALCVALSATFALCVPLSATFALCVSLSATFALCVSLSATFAPIRFAAQSYSFGRRSPGRVVLLLSVCLSVSSPSAAGMGLRHFESGLMSLVRALALKLLKACLCEWRPNRPASRTCSSTSSTSGSKVAGTQTAEMVGVRSTVARAQTAEMGGMRMSCARTASKTEVSLHALAFVHARRRREGREPRAADQQLGAFGAAAAAAARAGAARGGVLACECARARVCVCVCACVCVCMCVYVCVCVCDSSSSSSSGWWADAHSPIQALPLLCKMLLSLSWVAEDHPSSMQGRQGSSTAIWIWLQSAIWGKPGCHMRGLHGSHDRA